MPTILSPSQSLRLDALLKQVNTEGLDFSIVCSNTQNELPIINGLGTLSQATHSEISFLANPKYTQALQTTQAGAVILKLGTNNEYSGTMVLCSDPYLLYSRVAQWFERTRIAEEQATIHPSAYIDPQAEVGLGVTVGPFAVIESGAKLAQGAKIGAHAYIGQNCMIGADSIIHPRVTCYANTRIGSRSIIHAGAVLGADGFGFAPDSTVERGAWSKIPQFGGVLIGSDVEIGANTTIDRGALEDTVIADGVKLDNQIQIGHNTKIGPHTAMAGCTGVAGSAVIGARCTFGGSAMVSGHLTIVDDVHISAASLVISSVTKPGVYTSAFPIVEHKDWEKNVAVMRQLNKLRRRVQALESK